MSILLARVCGDTVYMATDTRVIVRDMKQAQLCECDYKIQKLENGILVGFVGDRKLRQEVFALMEHFTLDKNGELTYAHVVQKIAVPLFFGLKDAGVLKYDNEKEERLPYMQGDILLAYKDKLYEICTNFMVLRYETYQALGKGADFAQYAMTNFDENRGVNEQLVEALKLTAKYTHLVGAPYLLIDTKSQEYTLLREDEE